MKWREEIFCGQRLSGHLMTEAWEYDEQLFYLWTAWRGKNQTDAFANVAVRVD
jgi:hypothetical protein